MTKNLKIVIANVKSSEHRIFTLKYILPILGSTEESILSDITNSPHNIKYNSMIQMLLITHLTIEECCAICEKHITTIAESLADGAMIYFSAPDAISAEAVDVINLVDASQGNYRFVWDGSNFTAAEVSDVGLIGDDIF